MGQAAGWVGFTWAPSLQGTVGSWTRPAHSGQGLGRVSTCAQGAHLGVQCREGAESCILGLCLGWLSAPPAGSPTSTLYLYTRHNILTHVCTRNVGTQSRICTPGFVRRV